MCVIPGFPLPGGWFTLLLVGLAAVAVLTLARTRNETRRRAVRRNADADRDDALDILRRRLAEGAISPEEYERLRRIVALPATNGNR
jgi:putative membrane protein